MDCWPYFGIQLGRILEQVHAANIIHGDVKPDNIMLTIANLDERKSLEQLLSVGAPAALKLIDWGRSIDMEQFPAGKEFIGRAGTENFDCYEMTVSKFEVTLSNFWILVWNALDLSD